MSPRFLMAALIGGAVGAGAQGGAMLLSAPKERPSVLADTWMDLLRRCRVALETAKPLNLDGLKRLTWIRRSDLSRPVETPWSAWSPDDVVALLMNETESAGAVTRGCRVEMIDDKYRPSSGQEQAMLYQFLAEQARLTSAQTHYPREPAPLTDHIGAGYETSAPNEHGCVVETTAYFDPSELGPVMFASTERADGACGERRE